MKKYLALILALCMVFALCACGSNASAPAASPAADATDALQHDLDLNLSPLSL